MQIVKNLKHILVVTIVTFLMIFWVIQIFWKPFSREITHFFVYRDNISIFNFLYKYNFNPWVKDIAIIKIDDDTLNYLQSRKKEESYRSDQKMLNISKADYIELINVLESVGVKWIAFDIIFQNKDPYEELFADTIKKYDNIVIWTTTDICTPSNIPEETIDFFKKNRSDFSIQAFCDTDYNTSFIKKQYTHGEYKMDFPECFADSWGKYLNCTWTPRSIYNDIRWWILEMEESRDRRKTSVNILSGVLFPQWKYLTTLSLWLYKWINPLPHNSMVLQPFFWPEKIYPEYSLGKLLELAQTPSNKINLVTTFAWKYIFVGESSKSIQDKHRSPVTWELMDGVEFHAHFLDGILQNRFLTEYTLLDFRFFLGVIILIVTTVAIYMLFPKFIAMLSAVFVTLWIIWISRYLYFHYGIVLEMFPVLLAGSIFSFPITFIYRFFIVDREKRMLRSAFSHYVDPELVREISDASSNIKLWGETKELSILFSDIAGFTTISERTPVKDLFYLMSSYLSYMTDILTANGGTLDKYIGDAVMGFFGAPIPKADHARRACQTALDMRAALPKFNAELLARWLEAIDFRVWIGSGEVMVWNIGSKDRFNYTVLWDTVNLASRLEATSKEYGTHIIVSEATYLIAKEYFRFRKLDLITVKWKNDPVGIYELLADIRDNTIDIKKYDEYERGLTFYAKWEYLLAGQVWESQIEQDPPSRIMAHRCLEILKGDLIVENGVYHMTKK